MTLKKYKAVIFDLDGTLYESTKIDEANLEAAIDSIAEHLSLSKHEAKNLIDKQRKELGTKTNPYSISGSMKSLNIPENLIREKQKLRIKPDRYLKEDRELASLLKTLSERTKIALLTNTPSFIAIPILQALGINKDCFGMVLTGDELLSPKPSKADIERILNEFEISPEEAVFVGDRYHVDIQPAKELGLDGVLIDKRDNLISFLKEQLNTV